MLGSIVLIALPLLGRLGGYGRPGVVPGENV